MKTEKEAFLAANEVRAVIGEVVLADEKARNPLGPFCSRWVETTGRLRRGGRPASGVCPPQKPREGRGLRQVRGAWAVLSGGAAGARWGDTPSVCCSPLRSRGGRVR